MTTSANPVFHMGTSTSPSGRSIAVSPTSLLLDGRSWLPVMGEFHYARYPRAEWRDELLKMKSGGIDLVATYVFWIHHEEVQGRWNWTGDRDLRAFVQTVHDVGLLAVIRCGPWCHGEVRNGGFPDWLLTVGNDKLRTDDPAYLAPARTLYLQIAAQLRGLLWKDGGPVAAVQIENEYAGPAEHLLSLKRLAVDVGLDAPLYTRTGWPNLATPMPFGHLLPLHSGYAEGFWDRVLTPMPGRYWRAFTFAPSSRADAAVATDHFAPEALVADDDRDVGYPYLTCELGGGMMPSYHRRIRIAPEDILAVVVAKIGSGSNLPGYYMYHGGANPESATGIPLNESQSTLYTNHNDLPTKTYDFLAPLGESGQLRPHYHLLRRLHLFLHDFGDRLTSMPATTPGPTPSGADDSTTLRWSLRTDGRSGFVFVNNYQRLLPMPPKPGIQFTLSLDAGPLTLPSSPVTIPANATFFWPVNLDLAGITLTHATAQPLCQINDDDTLYVCFAQTPGVPTEFSFDASTCTLDSTTGTVCQDAPHLLIRDLAPSLSPAIVLRTLTGRRVSVLLLNDPTSLALWKLPFAGGDRLFLTRASLTIDRDELRLRTADPATLSVSIFPAPSSLPGGTPDGVFTRFDFPVPSGALLHPTVNQLRPAGPPRAIPIGRMNVAAAPTDADFAAAAAVYRITVPCDLDPTHDFILRLHYAGDVARLYLGDRFLTDHFFNGTALELSLRRFAPAIFHHPLTLQILSLPYDAPIYFPPDVRADHAVATLLSADLIRQFGRTLKDRPSRGNL